MFSKCPPFPTLCVKLRVEQAERLEVARPLLQGHIEGCSSGTGGHEAKQICELV
jgi:hypothetical protein